MCNRAGAFGKRLYGDIWGPVHGDLALKPAPRVSQAGSSAVSRGRSIAPVTLPKRPSVVRLSGSGYPAPAERDPNDSPAAPFPGPVRSRSPQ